MLVAVIAHVGETVGHLVRALAVADAIQDLGATPVVVTSRRAEWLLDLWPRTHDCAYVSWEIAHNSLLPDGPPREFVRATVETNRELRALLRRRRPQLVVSFPGLFTFQLARAEGIPHAAIAHGPYLSPLVRLSQPTRVEESVLGFTTRLLTGPAVQDVLTALHRELRLEPACYLDFARRENIIVPQPGLSLAASSNVRVVSFIQGTFGDPYPGADDLARTCLLTFGTGNPCPIDDIVQSAANVFERVIVSVGGSKVPSVDSRRIALVPFVSNSSLADRIGWVVSHGGIGTVGVFAHHGTPQVIIPTEPDQATMAVHARRAGIARAFGLDDWAAAPSTGRSIEPIDVTDLHAEFETLRAMETTGLFPSNSGAEEAARAALSLLG